MPRSNPFGIVLAVMTAAPGAALACEIHAAAVKSATPVAVVRHLPTIESWAFAPSPLYPFTGWFEDGTADGLRIVWDAESGTWAPAPAGQVEAGVFGARLPSDRPLVVTRADGTGLLLTGPEGIEYVMALRGADGRWLTRCLPHGTVPVPAPAAEPFPEK